MISYLPGSPKSGLYGLSYCELRADYWRFRSMANEEFLDSLISVLHFAVFVCWVKEVGLGVLDDRGLIHELVHLLDPKTAENARTYDLPRIRMDFNEVCELA